MLLYRKNVKTTSSRVLSVTNKQRSIKFYHVYFNSIVFDWVWMRMTGFWWKMVPHSAKVVQACRKHFFWLKKSRLPRKKTCFHISPTHSFGYLSRAHALMQELGEPQHCWTLANTQWCSVKQCFWPRGKRVENIEILTNSLIIEMCFSHFELCCSFCMLNIWKLNYKRGGRVINSWGF